MSSLPSALLSTKNRVCVSQVSLKVDPFDAAFMADMLHKFKRQNVSGGSCRE